MSEKDQIDLKQEKGTWRRTIKLIFKCHLPVLLIIAYIVIKLVLVNVGVSETDYTAQLFAGDVSVGLITKLVVVMIISMLGSDFSIFMRDVTSASIDCNARQSIWEKLLKIPMDFFKQDNPQEAISRIVNNITCVSSMIIFVLVPLLTASYSIFAGVRQVYRYDWRLSMVLLLYIPIAILVAFVTGRLKYSASKANSNVVALLTEQLSELITNIPLAKAFAREKHEQKRGEDMCGRLYTVSIKSGWIDQVSDLSFSLLNLLETLAIVLLGVFLMNRGSIEKRAWVAFFLFSSLVKSNVDALIVYWHNSKNIQGIITRVSYIMDYPDEPSGKEAADSMAGDMQVENVTFGYDPENLVLNNISCKFKQGTATAVLGVSGCGKSTMVNLIDRIYSPISGKITIGGKDIQEYALDSYRSRFAVISQNIMLFSGSIRSNLSFGLNKSVSDEEMKAALEKVGMDEYVSSFSEGIETQIGQMGNQLSGGQKQRLALARMLLSDAPYVILDEATASMDMIAISELKQVLQSILKDKTVIIIAHSPVLMSLVSNVIVLEEGKVAISDTMEEAMKKNAFLQKFMRGDDVDA